MIRYRIGDKVLQLVNSPEDNVFNGDMGQIVGITLAKQSEDKIDELVIQFDANEVTYKRNEWNKITLSYCCSIHKSQGSEFQMVILPMVHQYQRMLQRNLLYTAVTRSKDADFTWWTTSVPNLCQPRICDSFNDAERTHQWHRKMTPLQRAKLAQFEEGWSILWWFLCWHESKTSSTKIKEQSSTKVIANKQAAEKPSDSGLDLFALPRRSRQHQIRQKRQSLCQGIRS